MYTGKLLHVRVILLLIILLYNSTYCTAKLTLFNVNREELASFDTVNFMWMNSFDDSFSINGSFEIGEFSTSSSCTLNQSLTRNITVLLIKIDEALNSGCSSYADVIQSNDWLQSETTDETGPTPLTQSPPKIILFTSMNEIPGIREEYFGNLDILSKNESQLALIRTSDATQISSLKPKTSFVEFTSDSGPWIKLLDSKEWKIWSIIFGIIYSIIIISAFLSLVSAIKTYRFEITNPRLWLFIIIMIYNTIFLVMLEYDPWAIRYNYLSWLNYEIILMTGYFILCLCYSAYLFPWIKATRNLTEVVNYNIIYVRKLSRIFQSGVIIAILIKIASIIFYLLLFSPTKINIPLMALRVIFSILEILFCLFMIGSFGTFGVIIFFARIHELKTRRVREHRSGNGARKNYARREIFLSGTLMILVIISLLFITIQKVMMVYLSVTINSFWVIRITNDVANIFCSLVLITGLYSNTIGKYSHMIYTGSSDEDITTSTASRDSSLHNANAVSDVESTPNHSCHRRRSTIEILFGRNSLGL